MKSNAFHVAVILFEIHVPYSHSLKEKRKVLRRLRDLLSKQLNVSVAEVGFQDSWQRAQIACSAVSIDKSKLQRLRERVENLVLENLDGELIYCELEWL